MKHKRTHASCKYIRSIATAQILIVTKYKVYIKAIILRNIIEHVRRYNHISISILTTLVYCYKIVVSFPNPLMHQLNSFYKMYYMQLQTALQRSTCNDHGRIVVTLAVNFKGKQNDVWNINPVIIL